MATDPKHTVQKFLNVATRALKDAVEYAKDHSVSFVWKDAPFEAKYNANGDRWEVGSDYWNDSGCTIDYEEFEESNWNSSSAYC